MESTLWYFPLESLKSRYTEQLCERWMPNALKEEAEKKGIEVKIIKGENVSTDIKVGNVLDATGRGKFSLTQMNKFLKEIEQGNVKTEDIIYFQDFWTPGMEAVFYAIDLYKINPRIYSMLHAQSVDEFDFTYPMRNWMRHFELGQDRRHTGIFVGSTVHKNQLREAGYIAPIHVVSLPLDYEEVKSYVPDINKENMVVFSSRMDWEKNPHFMMDVAEDFLSKHEDWEWYVTSGGKMRSNQDGIIERARILSKDQPRFILREELAKKEYYDILAKAKIQFNSSRQDYVSWTLLEASAYECDLAYPDFRSFPECVPDERRYMNEDRESALNVMNNCINNPKTHIHIAKLADYGRRREADIIVNGSDSEVNIWKEHRRI